MSGTILIMAGGTGGHVFPALAVADQLRERGFRILWLGAENGMEGKLVRQYGYEIAELAVSRLRGGGLKRKLTAPFNLLRAVWQARNLISQRQPLLAVGFGGFASGPGGLAARLCKVPVVVHEQNAVPGLTNRLLSKMATVTLEGFQGAPAGWAIRYAPRLPIWTTRPVAMPSIRVACGCWFWAAARGPWC